MSQVVKISVHPFELHSALDSIHEWCSQFDWGGTSGSPSFIIELDIVRDEHGFAHKFTGNRFNQLETEPTPAERIIDLAHSQDKTSTAFSLMDHLREKTRG